MIKIKIKKLHEDAVIPEYQSDQAAGVDLRALENTYGAKGEVIIVRTGLALEIPKGCLFEHNKETEAITPVFGIEAQVRPRSGLAVQGITVVNSPGTIDSDYRGEIKIIMVRHNDTLYIQKGERIAQLVFTPILRADFVEVDSLGDTERGEGGLGHTGV